MEIKIPDGYKSILSVYDTQKAISLLKRLFEDRLAALLNLYRVSAPLFVDSNSGLNDNLNGYERPVSFDILRSDTTAQVVQSLAKWKRLALKRYNFFPGKGLYTDMDAIRRDEDELDNLHSVYVDQWDWEKVILSENRNLDYLKLTVMDIVKALCDTQDTMQAIYPQLQCLPKLERNVTFVTSQELEDMYPDMTSKQRENAFTREHKTVFIIGIGGVIVAVLVLIFVLDYVGDNYIPVVIILELVVLFGIVVSFFALNATLFFFVEVDILLFFHNRLLLLSNFLR